MNIIIWIVQGLLAAFFTMPAFKKLTTPKQKLVEAKQLAPDGSILPIRALGLVELLGVVGIIIPYLTGIAPVLTPLAALGFCVVMAGAFALHYKRHDYKTLPVLVIAFVFSGAVAYFRFRGL